MKMTSLVLSLLISMTASVSMADQTVEFQDHEVPYFQTVKKNGKLKVIIVEKNAQESKARKEARDERALDRNMRVSEKANSAL